MNKNNTKKSLNNVKNTIKNNKNNNNKTLQEEEDSWKRAFANQENDANYEVKRLQNSIYKNVLIFLVILTKPFSLFFILISLILICFPFSQENFVSKLPFSILKDLPLSEYFQHITQVFLTLFSFILGSIVTDWSKNKIK